jgi:hypothetical protein
MKAELFFWKIHINEIKTYPIHMRDDGNERKIKTYLVCEVI